MNDFKLTMPDMYTISDVFIATKSPAKLYICYGVNSKT